MYMYLFTIYIYIYSDIKLKLVSEVSETLTVFNSYSYDVVFLVSETDTLQHNETNRYD